MTTDPSSEQTEYWHVRVEAKGADPKLFDRLVVLDQDRDWIERRILQPRRQGAPITVEGRELDWQEIKSVRVAWAQEPSRETILRLEAEDGASPVLHVGDPEYPWRTAERATDMTNELIDGPAGQAQKPFSGPPLSERMRADPKKVMVVYGRDDEARRSMFDFLRALGLSPLEWGSLVASTGKGAPYIGEVLKHAFEVAQAVVVLFTPDDEANLCASLQGTNEPDHETHPTPQARPNVLFEAGMALGVHPDRTILVELGELRPFSDIYGRHAVRLNHTEKPLRDIARRLENIGCAVDTANDDWTTTTFPRRGGLRTSQVSVAPIGPQLDLSISVDATRLATIDPDWLTPKYRDDYIREHRERLLASLPAEDTERVAIFSKSFLERRTATEFLSEVEEYSSEAVTNWLTVAIYDHMVESEQDDATVSVSVTNNLDEIFENVVIELTFELPRIAVHTNVRDAKHFLSPPEPPAEWGDSGLTKLDLIAVHSDVEIEGLLEESTLLRFPAFRVRPHTPHRLESIFLPLGPDAAGSTIPMHWRATASSVKGAQAGSVEFEIPAR
jgi:predicted nucleotide-binding protein